MSAAWEYAVLSVEWAWLGDNRHEFTATAYVDQTEIYREVFTTMYWSAPLAEMGRRGWELVGMNPQNVLAPSWVKGYPGNISVPVVMVFIFKRQASYQGTG